MIYFFVVVLLFPPLSSLVVEVLFVELAGVVSVLPGVPLVFALVVATVGEIVEEPEPETPEEAEAVLPLPPPPLEEVFVTSVVCEVCVFQ